MMLRNAALCCFLFLTACANPGGGPPWGNNPPHVPVGPVQTVTETIAAQPAQTLVPIPRIGGTYSGQLVLPSGSGTAMLTFSLNAPSGLTPLNPNTPEPTVAYLTITAQSAFTLQSAPGLNLSVPTQYMAIVMWLNEYDGTAWSSRVLGTPSTTSGMSAMCFAPFASAVTLAPGSSLYLGINGDDVIPTPTAGPTPPPACPQAP